MAENNGYIEVSVLNPLTVQAWVEQVVSQGGSIAVDTAMSNTSTNAVENRVIKAYVDSAMEDEIVYATFTIGEMDGDSATVSVSLTAAQIEGHIANGKKVILKGTGADSRALELPFVGKNNSGIWFGAASTPVTMGILVDTVFITKGLFPSKYYSRIVAVSDYLLMGEEVTSGQVTLSNDNGDSWDVYETNEVDSLLGDKVDAADISSTVVSGGTDPVNSVAVIGYAGKKVSKTTVSGTSVTQALTENTFYVFGTVSSLTVTLATPADANIVNEYHFRFTSGSTATTLTLPQSVTMPSGWTVAASKTYEISIVDGYGTVIEW